MYNIIANIYLNENIKDNLKRKDNYMNQKYVDNIDSTNTNNIIEEDNNNNIQIDNFEYETE